LPNLQYSGVILAKFDIFHPATDHLPAFTESIEARIWALGGTSEQPFYIGSGLNFHADGTLWVEIIYCVEGAQIFYTRNFLQHSGMRSDSISSLESRLDELAKNGEGKFGFGDMLPETSIILNVTKRTYEDNNDEIKEYCDCNLVISADTGAVFGRTGPGMRSVDIKLDSMELEDGLHFMREMINEIAAVQMGKHPNPADFPCGSSEWPFMSQLNQKAYDKISEEYEEDYFENQLLSEAFDEWSGMLPIQGNLLDAGCGIGKPVIARLIDRGFKVTGSDFSAAMLRRAREKFPEAKFIEKSSTALSFQEEFDGICSFNSTLYLDPIDLLNCVYRYHLALRPGGLLFLYAYDPGPDWRGEPFHHTVGQWMWSWHYGMDEAADLLEEHGYFEVLSRRKVQWDKDEDNRIAQEIEKQNKEEEEYRNRQESDPSPFPIMLPFMKTPIERSSYAYMIIARRC
jgi:SAM-dependent methyltransferase